MPNRNKKLFSDFAEVRASTPRTMRWGFGAMVAVIVFITALGYWRGDVGQRSMDEVISNELATVEILYRLQFAARERTLALFGAMHAEDPFIQDSEIQRFYRMGTAYGTVRSQLEHLRLSQTERALLTQNQRQTASIMPQHYRVIELLKSGHLIEAEKLLVEQVVPAQDEMINTLTTLLDGAIRRTHEHAASARLAQHRATALFVAGGLAGILLTWGIFVLVTRRMSGLVTRLADTSERLHESNHNLQFRQLALDAHNIVSVADLHGTITAVNDKFCEVSQYTREELVGHNHRMIKSGRHADTFYDDLWTTIRAGQVWHGEICNRRKDGTFYWVASTILPFVGEDGLPSRYVSVRTEITPIKEAQLVLERSRDELERLVQLRSGELAEREEVLRSITNAAQDAVIMIDASGLVTYWNPGAEHMFGYSESEAMGQNLHDLTVPERYLERAQSGFSQFVEMGKGPSICRTTTQQAKHKTGREFPVDVSLSAIQLRGQWSAVGIVRDASERVRFEEQLKQLATTDPLTGISNRRRFDEALASEVNRAVRFSSPLTLILFDIDHFKRINDTFGHQAGDRVLIQLTLAVSGLIRTTDLFARWGGEEFVILMPGSDLDAGRVLAEKLRMMLEMQPFPDVGHMTCSFGVAEYGPGSDVDTLMRKVDRCMFQAKASGRNRVETTETTPEPEAG